MPSRRSVLVGLGGLVAGGGALIGTGAFTTVEAERDVTVSTAGDASANLQLTALNEEIVSNDDGDGIISIDLSNLNEQAETTFRDLVQIANNGTQSITSLTLEMSQDDGDVEDSVFEFPVSRDGSSETFDNGDDILSGDDISDDLGSGDGSVDFGIIVDLLPDEEPEDNTTSIDGNASFTLTITAETDDSVTTSS